MSMGKAEVKVENAIVIVTAEVDMIAALKEMAAKTENTIDDSFVAMFEAARDGLDWKGLAKEL